MTIFCVGSINIDRIYRVKDIPKPGETLRSTSLSVGLGGKGANTSVALARAGAKPVHIGAISDQPQDDWVLDELARAGVDVGHVARLDVPTGHAVVQVADSGENAITLFPGANECLDRDRIEAGLAQARPGDWLALQNETNDGAVVAKRAKEAELKVAYVAAPFDPAAVQEIIGLSDLVAMNELEAAGFEAHAGVSVEDPGLPDMLVTMGARGAKLISAQAGVVLEPARPVDRLVDTTCAGDTYFGYFLCGLSRGLSPGDAMRVASAAASLAVQKPGASASIPYMSEVRALLDG